MRRIRRPKVPREKMLVDIPLCNLTWFEPCATWADNHVRSLHVRSLHMRLLHVRSPHVRSLHITRRGVLLWGAVAPAKSFALGSGGARQEFCFGERWRPWAVPLGCAPGLWNPCLLVRVLVLVLRAFAEPLGNQARSPLRCNSRCHAGNPLENPPKSIEIHRNPLESIVVAPAKTFAPGSGSERFRRFWGRRGPPGKLDFDYWEPRFRPPKSQKIRRYAPKRAPFNFWGGGRGPRSEILFFLNEAF